MRFAEMPYQRPDPKAIVAQAQALTKRLKDAGSYEEAHAVFLEYEEKTKAVSTTAILAYVRQSIDTRDPYYNGEKAPVCKKPALFLR